MSNDEAGFEVELTANADRNEPCEHGNGYGHFSVIVADLDAAHRRMTDLGHAPREIREFKKGRTALRPVLLHR